MPTYHTDYPHRNSTMRVNLSESSIIVLNTGQLYTLASPEQQMPCREEDQLGDTSTLADPSVVQTLLKMRGQ